MKGEMIDLGLGSDGEDHPRRLVLLPHPNKTSHPHLLAFGGDDGTISLLETGSDGKLNVKVARRFDDPVRTVSSSHDGKRVAVGFEDGSTQVFVYPADADSSLDQHGFISKNNDDILDPFLSQPEDSFPAEESFPGPRFDAPVRSMEFDPRSYHLAIASESGFCVVDVTTSKTLQETGRLLQDLGEREHDSSGIRGVTYSTGPSTTHLYTLAMDGRLCTWDVTAPMNDPQLEWELEHRDSSKCIPKADVGEINGSDPCDRSCLPVAGNRFISLPGQTDVQLRKTDNMEEDPCLLPSLQGRGHTDTIVATAFSPDGKYLVTSGRDSRVILWRLNDPAGNKEDNENVGSFVRQIDQYKSVPTHLMWRKHPDDNDILYVAFADGTLTTVSGCDLVPSLKSVSAPKEAESNSNGSKTNTAGETNGDPGTDSSSSNPKPPESAEPRKRLSKKAASGDASDDSDEELDGGVVEAGSGNRTVTFLEDEAQEDDTDDSDVCGDGSNMAVTRDDSDNEETEDNVHSTEDDFNFDHHDDHDELPISTGTRFVEAPEPQPAFAPSSTPLDLPRRIMCWNHIGAASLFRNQDGFSHNSIDIDFTDISIRKPISFTDNMDFILGSLGEDGAIFATDLKDADEGPQDDVGRLVDGLNMSEGTKSAVKRSHRKKTAGDKDFNNTGSSIYFYRYETFGALKDKDWYVALPDDERAMGCACGEGWAAVITSRRFLRLFSSGGNQGEIIWLKGEPVTITGRSRFLAVFYHDGTPLPDGTQKLGFSLFDAVADRMITKGPVSCVSGGASLAWVGFSNDGSLMAMDSEGMLSMLVSKPSMSSSPDAEPDVRGVHSWVWEPMLDTLGHRKSPDESFWPITVQEGKLVCVPLKGGNEHPDAARRPVTHTLGLRIPLARAASDISPTLEELSVRANVALSQKFFLNEASDEIDQEDVQAEYATLCAQVDKATLKLFFATVKAGKLERALDLVDRLHLEKSFEIAVRAAEQFHHRNLSDRIEDVRERKFAVMSQSSDDSVEESYVAPRKDLDRSTPSSPYAESLGSKRISPEHSKRPFEETYDSDAESPPPKKSNNREVFQYEDEDLPDETEETPVRQSNPFAKKRFESPMKPSYPATKSQSRLALSRSSTFSTQSRIDSKVSRRII